MSKDKPYFCELDGKNHSKITIVRVLKKFNISPKEYYDSHYRKDGEGYCKRCNAEIPFVKFSYRDFCNTKCSALFNSQNAGKYWSKLSDEEKEAVGRKIVETRNSRYDMKDMLNKREKTYEEKYGMDVHSFYTKMMSNRWANATDEQRLAPGTRNNGSHWKQYEYQLDGKIVKVQGYERFVLDHLKEFFEEKDMKVGRTEVPTIYYVGIDKKKHRYFPDIFIESHNLLIEVKSPWTYNSQKETTHKKLAACEEEGFNVLLVVWNIKTPLDAERSKNELYETISSRATEWKVEGSTTIPRGSRSQVTSKYQATQVVDDIV